VPLAPQGREIAPRGVADEDHVAAAAAVAAVGTAARHVRLSAKADDTVAAGAALDIDAGSVKEHRSTLAGSDAHAGIESRLQAGKAWITNMRPGRAGMTRPATEVKREVSEMKIKKSRLATMGVLALVLSVTVGLLSGSVADAKKKKKKTATTFTVTKTTPTAIPLSSPTAPGVIKIPIGTIAGKKFKNKIVSFRGISVTTTWTGDSGFANGINASLIGPTGRETGISAPFPNLSGGPPTETSSGPTTETPNSPSNVCVPDLTPPPPPCNDPDDTLGPPYAGTIGNLTLLAQSGASPVGTWTLKVFHFSTTVNAQLASITVTGNLVKALPTK
jgi:hypothetical protein